MTPTFSHYEEALAYAERGLLVLPLWWVSNGVCACPSASCGSPGKHPIGHLVPRGVHGASSDPGVVSSWFDDECPLANIGLATGAVAGFDALDVDGDAGKRALHEYEREHGPLPKTPRTSTGGGGLHVLLAHREGLKNKTRFRDGLDVRADGGYIVAPPSIHVSGVRYEWTTGLDDAPVAPWPQALISMIENPGPSSNGSTQPGGQSVFPEGTRNEALASLAGTMRRRGMGRAAIEAALLRENDTRCQPPMDAAEVRSIAASIARYEPAAPVSNELLPCTDVGNAQRLVRFAAPNLRFVQGWGWMFFDGRRWVRNAEADAVELMKHAADRIWDEVRLATDKEEKRKRAAWAIKSQDAYRIKSALALARSDPSVRTAPDAFDRDPYLLSVGNGRLDLRSGELRQHRDADLITRLTDVQYEADAAAPRWRAFLRRVVPDVATRDFLRRWFGYCLTGDTGEQSLVFLHGVGANGKSVLIETIRAVMGEYGRATPFGTFVQRRPDAATNDLAALVGVRMAVASEPDEGVRLSESVVKHVTGGDMVSARFLYREYFEFRPDFKVCLVGNHQPRIKGTDHGIWRRILLVPFPVVVPKEQQDRRLAEKLCSELPGILAWMVRGCREWLSDGLKAPSAVVAATEQYRKDEDRLGRFLDEDCESGGDRSVTAGELRTAYTAWCEREGERPLSQKRVGSRLSERGLLRKKGRAGWTWIGIGLRGCDP